MRKWEKYCLSGLLVISVLLVSCQEDSQRAKQNNRDSVNIITEFTADSVQSEFFQSYSPQAVMGEVVYAPVYSHIYQQGRNRTFNLTSTLSFRNTDITQPITLKKVYYFDSKGNLVEKYLDENKIIAPLSSVSYVIEESDLRGGVGANFLVLWEAEQNVKKPVIETVMISTSGQQGISFVSEGRVIHSFEGVEN